MDSRNDRIRDYLGVTAWHRAGYTGKRGLSVLGEDFLGAQKWEHAYQAYAVFKEIAPDREVVYVQMEYGKAPPVNNLFVDYVVPEVEKLKADTVCVSIAFSTTFDGLDDALDPLMPYSTWTFPVGNLDMGFPLNRLVECKNIFGVGACTLMVDGQLLPSHYSVESEFIDVCSIANFNVNGVPLSGTSFAAPALAGMCALVNDFFIEKSGKPLSSEMMYQFLKDHSRDLSAPGHDTKTGWGIVILPPPESIDIRRYAGEMRNSRNIDDLRPDVAANCRKMIEIAKRDGYPILVTGTVRDKEYQEYCYYKGTSKSRIPTFHSEQAGLAFDICKNVKGEEYSDSLFWKYVGTLGKTLGFTWGGDWKSFVDKPHFQWDDHGKYTGNDILAGRYPPPMPLYKEEEEVTQEQFQAMYDKVNPVYVTLDDVPDYWREETRQLIEKGKLRGDGTGRLNIRHETLRAVIIAER